MAPNPGLPKASRCQNLVLTVNTAVILFRGLVSSEQLVRKQSGTFRTARN